MAGCTCFMVSAYIGLALLLPECTGYQYSVQKMYLTWQNIVPTPLSVLPYFQAVIVNFIITKIPAHPQLFYLTPAVLIYLVNLPTLLQSTDILRISYIPRGRQNIVTNDDSTSHFPSSISVLPLI